MSKDLTEQDTATEDLDVEDLFERLSAWFKTDRDHWADWRRDALIWYDFVTGNQWSEEEKAALRAQMRPEVTFNRLAVIVDTISGSEVNNRQEVRYIPRENGDVKVNEVLTAAGDWFRDSCHAEDEESDSFMDAVICGLGFTETRLDFDENPDGDPIIERIDPLEMVIDCASRRSNAIDARRMFRVKDMSRREAREMFPDADPAVLDADWARDEEGSISHKGKDTYKGRDGDDDDISDDDRVTIVQCQWAEMEDAYRVTDPQTGRKLEIDEEQRANIPPHLKVETYKKRVFYQAFLGSEVLEKQKRTLCGKMSWNVITGKRDRNAGTWYGIVKAMIDPQRWANKWLSQTLHIMNSNAKGGIMAEADAFADPKQASETWSRPDGITVVNPGALSQGKIQPKPVAQMPTAFFQLTEFAMQGVRDVSGVNLEMLGAADRDQPGVLEYQRRQSAMTVLARMFDSLRRYRKRQGELMLALIVDYLSDGRLIRIVGDEKTQYVPLVRQQNDTTEFDVIVDQASSAPNAKEQAWGVMQQMLPIVAPMLTPDLWADIVTYSPLPASFVDKVKAHIAEAQNAPQQADPAIEAAKQKLIIDQQAAQMQMEIKRQEAQLSAEIEIAKAQRETATKQQAHDMDMAMAMQKHALDVKNAELAQRTAEHKAMLDFANAKAKGAEQAESAATNAAVGHVKLSHAEEQAKIDQVKAAQSIAHTEAMHEHKAKAAKEAPKNSGK